MIRQLQSLVTVSLNSRRATDTIHMPVLQSTIWISHCCLNYNLVPK